MKKASTNWMMRLRASRAFTLAEVMIASAVLIISVTMAVRSYIYLIRQWRQREIQELLDAQVQASMERVKNDLRLSGLEEMVFYPNTGATYNAVSFAMARDDDGDGTVELDADNRIIWDYTIIYHIKAGSPDLFCRTVIDPRNTSMPATGLYAQLQYVVTNGNSCPLYTDTNSNTSVIFSNLVDFVLTPKGSIFDGYGSSLAREEVVFGSAYITGGMHTVQFSVIGKNAASSGYSLGVDSLYISPSYSVREAETQTVAWAVGGTVTSSYESGGSFSGNWKLQFNATASGQYFAVSMTNDQWHETNFKMGGQDYSNTEVVMVRNQFEVGSWASTNDPQYAVRLPLTTLADSGLPTNNYWSALLQSGYNAVTSAATWPQYEATGSPPYFAQDHYANAAIRVLVKGSDMINGGYIPSSSDALGHGCYGWTVGGKAQLSLPLSPWIMNGGGVEFVCFGTSYSHRVRIDGAFIAECASSTTPTQNIVEGTSRRLTFNSMTNFWQSPTNHGSDTSFVFQAFGSMGTDGTNYHIDKSKTYAITYLVSSVPFEGNPRIFRSTNNNVSIQSYYIPGGATGAPNVTNCLEYTNWTDFGSAVIPSSNVIGIWRMWLNNVSNGTFTSGIFDTKKTSPTYGSTSWDGFRWYGQPWSGRIALKFRSADDAGMTGAVAWSTLSWDYDSPGSVPSPHKRYVQFQAYLEAGSYGWAGHQYTHMNYAWGPILNSVTIPWAGDSASIDVGAILAKNTNYGIYAITVDSNEIVKGLTADLEIFANAPLYYGTNRELSSRLATEVLPRNTGK